MKKIVAINCSPRTAWNTATLVREAARGAEDQGAEVTVIDLYKLEKFTGCVSCFGCKLPDNLGKCVCKDGLYAVLEEIRKIETELGYGEMLELIQKPRTRIDAKSGETVIEGMTYGDAEILMECYNSVIWFTRGEIL